MKFSYFLMNTYQQNSFPKNFAGLIIMKINCMVLKASGKDTFNMFAASARNVFIL